MATYYALLSGPFLYDQDFAPSFLLLDEEAEFDFRNNQIFDFPLHPPSYEEALKALRQPLPLGLTMEEEVALRNGPVIHFEDISEEIARACFGCGGYWPESFQFILMASTSPAVPLHQETLTYLNQGQTYEIRFKKLGAPEDNASLYKSVLRITFHGRPQKAQEKVLLQEWREIHPGEQLMVVDSSWCLNTYDLKSDAGGTFVEFFWDPSKQTSVYIKVNCISTEFTTKKHGGEKGVPFRLTIETYGSGETEEEQKQIHSAYAQIRVFKTKGADRKNKTDREKADRRVDREKFQPAYDYTVFTDSFPGEYDVTPDGPPIVRATASTTSNEPLSASASNPDASNPDASKDSSAEDAGSSLDVPEEFLPFEPLPESASPVELAAWLKKARFSSLVRHFLNYSAKDLYNLSQDELILICKPSDGIRLHKILHPHSVCPKVVFYVRLGGGQVFAPVVLRDRDRRLAELKGKLAEIIGTIPGNIREPIIYEETTGVPVRLTDEILAFRFPDGTPFEILAERTAKTPAGDAGEVLPTAAGSGKAGEGPADGVSPASAESRAAADGPPPAKKAALEVAEENLVYSLMLKKLPVS